MTEPIVDDGWAETLSAINRDFARREISLQAQIQTLEQDVINSRSQSDSAVHQIAEGPAADAPSGAEDVAAELITLRLQVNSLLSDRASREQHFVDELIALQSAYQKERLDVLRLAETNLSQSHTSALLLTDTYKQQIVEKERQVGSLESEVSRAHEVAVISSNDYTQKQRDQVSQLAEARRQIATLTESLQRSTIELNARLQQTFDQLAQAQQRLRVAEAQCVALEREQSTTHKALREAEGRQLDLKEEIVHLEKLAGRHRNTADAGDAMSLRLTLPPEGLVEAVSVDDLLDLQDETFVAAAYLGVLGREADAEGLSNYLKQLRRGISKKDIVIELALSSEGRNKEVGLVGLSTLLSASANRTSWSIRTVWTRFFASLAWPVTSSLRMLENASYRQHLSIQRSLRAMEPTVTELLRLNKRALSDLQDIKDFATERRYKVDSSAKSEASPPTASILFNLSTSRHWRAPPVGIVRMERELATYLRSKSAATFVVWNPDIRRLEVLTSVEVDEILSDRWCNPAVGTILSSGSRRSIKPQSVDTYISIGLDWDLCPLQDIGRVLIESKCKVVLACHDIVPILFPEFCVDETFPQRFKQHFVNMAHLADVVAVISARTQGDLETFWARAEINRIPAVIKKIPLAHFTPPHILPPLAEIDVDRLRHIEAGGDFVLYVSSLEIRKNHRLLLNIWRKLYKTRGLRCPTLVLVGMTGWGVRNLMEQMQRMEATSAGKIIYLSDVKDDFLWHLYQKCLFTVFPSHYEGWGLAATEAMAFGKVCVVSNNSSLPEATQHIMPALHPLDFPGWLDQIENLLDSPRHRCEIEARLAERFEKRDWSDFAADFLEQVGVTSTSLLDSIPAKI